MRTKVGALVWSIAAFILVLTLVVGQVGTGFNIETNILKLLPNTEIDPAIDLAFERFSEKNMRKLVFLVGNSDAALAKQGADQLTLSLEQSPWIENVVLNIPPDEQQEIGRFNYSYRHHLLTTADERLLTEESYEEFTDDVIQQIYSPFSGGLAELLGTDPFLLSYRFGIANSTSQNQVLTLDDGYLLASLDETYVLVTADLAQSPFDSTLQQQLIARIGRLETLWAESSPGNQLIKTGALFYAEYAYNTARHEVSVIGGSSLILVIALIAITFFSIRPLGLVSLALAFGIGLGFALVHALFDEVHLLTLVFGASLIGVAVDYAFHYFAVDSGKVDDFDGGNRHRINKIFPAITMGLMSSVIGYLALLSTPFPGLQQMAIFCIAGLTGAYLTVVLLFPIIPLKNKKSTILLSLCQKFLVMGSKKPAKAFLQAGLLLPFIAFGLMVSNDFDGEDVREFQAQDSNLLVQEEFIKSILNAPAANQFYLVKGADPEELLINLEKASAELDALVEAGVIDGSLNITQWLPSRQRQESNYKLYQGLYDSDAMRSLVDLGLSSEVEFAAAKQLFSADDNKYLLPEVWLDSPLSEQMSYLWLDKINNDYVAVVAIRGINQLGLLANIDANIIFIDKVSTISQLLSSYQQSASLLLLVAIGVIAIGLLIRFGLRKGGLVLLSPVIAISAAITGLVLIGETVSLFNILALFLVLGIGIDFGIFFAEADALSSNTLLAVLLSALTTIFSFGLLALSDTSVIHSFGLTMLIGISMAFILSPIIGNLVVADKEKPNGAN